MTNEELVKEVCPIFGSTGWAHYFEPATQAKGTELGLDGLQFYVIGRGRLYPTRAARQSAR